MSESNIKIFNKNDADKLFSVLTEKNVIGNELADATSHALYDISESIEKIFNNIIPSILVDNENPELLKKSYNDLKEEFSHILYHIEDAKLYGLKYWEE